MSRMNKWKLEKTKVKVVFRLQFHATHIPLSGWDKLFISFIPADTGKVTSKTTKANVRNGTCKWGDPIYETTRLLQDIKTKQYEEKLYKLVVAMGTSRSSVLGEATINLADYADASKPSVAVLPLHGSDSGPALHVTVQLLTSKTGFREFEQQRELRERGLQTAHNSSDESSGRKMSSSEESIREQINKVHSRVRFSDKPKDPMDEEEPGFDVSSNTSESLCAEKHENDSVKSTASGQSPQPNKTGQPDWVRCWNSDNPTHNELDTVIEENNRLRGALESAESSILELKLEVSSLQSHADEIGREAELFAEQLATEILSSEMLVKEVAVLKSECLKLKEDLEQLKATKVSFRETGSHENGLGFDVYQPEIGMLNSGKIFELLRDLEESKGERDCLAKKTEQMECYYEGLVQELEENQRRMLLELQNLQHEHSGCLYSITSANEQIVILANENRDLEAQRKELEKRALVAEAAVKRARLNYSIAVDQLQKDLELLSFQVLSMHEVNENLIREAFVDSSPAWSVRVDSGKQKLGGDIRSDNLKRSLQLQEGIYRKVEQEFCEIEVRNLYLEVFSTVLRETVVGSSENAKLTKQKMNELEMKLRIAVDEVHSLDAKCNEMALVNRNLEVNLQTLMQENHLFAEKIRELDSLVMQYRGFENRYTACAAENTELTYLLEKKTLEIGILQSDNFSLRDKLKAIKTEFDESRNLVQFLEEKMRGLLSSFDKVYSFLAPESRDLQADGLTGIVAKLENLQHNACEKILELVEANKCVVNERDAVKLSHVAAESEIALMKKKLEHEIGGLTGKLEALVSRFDSSNFEERYMKQHTEHLSGLDSLEVQLQEIASKNAELSQDILALETGTAAELREENQALIASLEAKNEESSRLASELESLKESLESLRGEKQILIAKMEESTQLAKELNSLKESLQSLQSENQALIASLEAKNEESSRLALELESLKESLESMHCEKRTLMAKTEESTQLAEELSSLKESFHSLQSENQALMVSSEEKAAEVAKLVSELDNLKGNLQSVDVEKEALMLSLQEKDELALEINNLKESLQSLQDERQALVASLQVKNEESSELQLELESLKESLESLQDEKRTLMAKTVESTQFAEELSSLKESLKSFQSERQALVESLEAKNEESGKLQSELESLKESLESLQGEKRTLMACSLVKTEESTQLAEELKGLKESVQSLRSENEDLMACLREKDAELDGLNGNLQSLSSEKEVLMLSLKENDELASVINNLKESLESLNVEKEALMLSLQEKDEASANLALEINDLKESLQSVNVEKEALISSLQEKDEASANLALEMNNLKESLQSLNVEKEALVLSLQEKDEAPSEMALEINNLRESLQSLQDENRDLVASSQEKIDEIDKLQAELNSSRESLQVLGDENRALKCLESEMADHVSDLKEKETQLLHLVSELCETLEVLVATDVRLTFLKSQYESQLAELQKKHIDTETTLNCCVASNRRQIEENEQLLMSLNTLRSELEANRNRDINASQLSEEEIDNLMLANEESEVKVLLLKAKLDEKQNQIIAIQGYRDELKKQFNETTQKLAEQTMKAEEFKNLSIHLKEMKDKAEASKPEPEASLRVVFIKEQYETKLQELKQQLSVSKKHGEEILLKLQDTIDEVENLKKSEAIHLKKNEELGVKILDLEAELQILLADKREITKAYEMMKAEMECSSISLECCKEEKRKLEASLEECCGEKEKIAAELTRVKETLENSNCVVQNDGSCIENRLFNDERSVNVNEVSASCSSSNGDEIDQNSDHIAENGIRSPVKSRQSDIINNHLRAESLRISMDNLSNELERMKNENLLLQDHDLEVKYPNLQSELRELEKANKELGIMFPSYNEFSGSGNSLERVLALEMELAEALQAKKRSTIHFQSSFLKQHSDEEAVFKSFRDINDLIKDMLEIKGRYSSVEKELKEMHDRYSQLSLQFAEVEGERQKLMMTLKNVRASKKALQLNRSASASLGDHSL